MVSSLPANNPQPGQRGPGCALSVVIAAWPDTAGLAGCLGSLAAQQDASTEVLVASPVDPPDEVGTPFPGVRWLKAGPHCLIPHLWGLGVAQARGEVVALTTAHFRPDPDWVAAVRRAHARLEAPAVGGRIAPPRGGRAADWATYFLRYSAYLKYRHEQEVPDVAGDNASYKRSALEPFGDVLKDGFWELNLHRQLRQRGQAVVFDPAVRVVQQTSFGFRRFLAQRFRHGRQFGSSRFRGSGVVPRAAALLGSPLIPALLLGKVTGRVVRSGRDFGPFLRALPLLACFILAWSLGEASGYLSPQGPSPRGE